MARPRQQVGKRVSAAAINSGVEARDLIDAFTGGGGVNVTTGKNGVAFALGASIPGLEFAKATTSITPGTPSSAGSGTIQIYQPTFNGGAAATNSVTFTVYNYGPAYVASGSYVYIRKIHGVWVLDEQRSFPVVLTSTLMAKSGSTPGTGSANPQTYNGSTLGTDTGVTLTINSNFSSSVASGKTLWATPWAGALWVGPADC